MSAAERSGLLSGAGFASEYTERGSNAALASQMRRGGNGHSSNVAIVPHIGGRALLAGPSEEYGFVADYISAQRTDATLPGTHVLEADATPEQRIKAARQAAEHASQTAADAVDDAFDSLALQGPNPSRRQGVILTLEIATSVQQHAEHRLAAAEAEAMLLPERQQALGAVVLNPAP